MKPEDEHEGFNNTLVDSQKSVSDNMASEAALKAEESTPISPPRIRHVYLEEENTYGRFVPFLLLKDELHSQIDSSGNSVLHHMCSHNSPYLPLYLSTLKHGDPILNRASKLGHTPLDVAGLYCRREYVEMLKEKGAIDQGKVDHWAIQGAHLENWSGTVDLTKPMLIHWAAYNDLPEVLAEYARQGSNMNEVDTNGNTPVEIAVNNKSYRSAKVLAELGCQPKPETLENSGSKYLQKLFAYQKEPESNKRQMKILKLIVFPLFLVYNCLFAATMGVYVLGVLTLCLWIYLLLKSVDIEPSNAERRTAFKSDLIGKEINYKSNHCEYCLLLLLTVLTGLLSLLLCHIDSYLLALLFWVDLVVTLTWMVNLSHIVYGVVHNLTHEEMFQPELHPELWSKINYIIQRNILSRTYGNKRDKSLKENLRDYWNQRRGVLQSDE